MMAANRRRFLSTLAAGALVAKPLSAQEEALPPDISTRAGEDWPALLGPRGDSISTGPEPGAWQIGRAHV